MKRILSLTFIVLLLANCKENTRSGNRTDLDNLKAELLKDSPRSRTNPFV